MNNPKSTSVFIIDDYLINLKVAQAVIKKHGFFQDVTTFLDAEKALAHIELNINNTAALPEIILLDLSMPVMDGWQFLEKFEAIYQSLQKEIYVFILSSSSADSDKQRAKQYKSVKGYLTKPLTADMLQYVIEVLALPQFPESSNS